MYYNGGDLHYHNGLYVFDFSFLAFDHFSYSDDDGGGCLLLLFFSSSIPPFYLGLSSLFYDHRIVMMRTERRKNKRKTSRGQ